MASNIHRLTDRQIKNAAKPLSDGGNLWVYPQGKALNWILRYTLQGRAREMGLGAYPAVSLVSARKAAAGYREVLKSGVDPIDYRDAQAQAEALKAAGVPTFTQAAARYIRAHRRGWSNLKHARQWVAALKSHEGCSPSRHALPGRSRVHGGTGGQGRRVGPGPAVPDPDGLPHW